MPKTVLFIQASNELSVVPERFTRPLDDTRETPLSLTCKCAADWLKQGEREIVVLLAGSDPEPTDVPQGVRIVKTETAAEHAEAMVWNSRDTEFFLRTTAATPFIHSASLNMLLAGDPTADRLTFNDVGVTFGLERVRSQAFAKAVDMMKAAEAQGADYSHARAHGGLPLMYLAHDAKRTTGLLADDQTRGGFAEHFKNASMPMLSGSVKIEPGVNLHVSGLTETCRDEDCRRISLVLGEVTQRRVNFHTPVFLSEIYKSLALPMIDMGDPKAPRSAGTQSTWAEWSAYFNPPTQTPEI